MTWIALRMLVGNAGKYISIVMGVAFASLLISQQASIFCGLMQLTANQIRDIQDAEIWVMDQNVQFVDDIKPMSENELLRVRGVPGVDWAVKLYKGISRAKLSDGNYQQVVLLGLDDGSLIGAPREILAGNLEDLRRPDSIILDERGARQIFPDDPYRLGRTFEINDHRAIVVGICKAGRTFQTFPIVYTRFSQALDYVPKERKVLSFILAQSKSDVSAENVCASITAQTGLKALTSNQFMWTTIRYYMTRTGIPINFGVTVLLGFIVGTAICGQTFYLFTIENLKQFGTLKALGTTNLTIARMILLQAIVVGLIGYGLGIGGAALFGKANEGSDRLAFFMPWQVLVITAVAVLLIIGLSSLLSLRKVWVLEPAIVFRGE